MHHVTVASFKGKCSTRRLRAYMLMTTSLRQVSIGISGASYSVVLSSNTMWSAVNLLMKTTWEFWSAAVDSSQRSNPVSSYFYATQFDVTKMIKIIQDMWTKPRGGREEHVCVYLRMIDKIRSDEGCPHTIHVCWDADILIHLSCLSFLSLFVCFFAKQYDNKSSLLFKTLTMSTHSWSFYQKNWYNLYCKLNKKTKKNRF